MSMMFLPRRRITSLTLATIIVFTLWYLNLIPGFPTGVDKSVPSVGSKQRPADGRLAPPTIQDETQDEPSSVVDVGSSSPATASPKVPAIGNPTSEEPSEKIITDTRPPPPGPPKLAPSKSSPSSKATSKPMDSQPSPVPNIKFQQGPLTFGSRIFTEKNPLKKFRPFAQGEPQHLPRLQHAFGEEDRDVRRIRLERLGLVKKSFAHSWAGYKMNAWMKDELQPVEGGSVQSFGGWAASLVDTLDTLWIVGMKQEFKEAVEAVSNINFNVTSEEVLNVFETTIRYLGGFLGAYDLSHGHEEYPVLLQKAIEVGDLLYCAFDTPNRMPVTRWRWQKALEGEDQIASTSTLVAEIGSLTLEMTRLSQLTGDMKYYDAVTRIMDEFRKAQDGTKLPGLWPVVINAKKLVFEDNGFTLGGMADSLYEYLPKQYMLLGGRGKMYQEMYESALTAAMNHIFFQPMLPDNADVLFSGSATVSDKNGIRTKAEGQHLGCYAGGMVGIGGKLFKHPEHLNMARKLVDGCIWAYKHTPTGIMPEIFSMVPCAMNSNCTWDEKAYRKAVIGSADPDRENNEADFTQIVKQRRLPPGFVSIKDKKYILRPEAIESIFIHYRLTGDKDLPDKAWQMFEAIENATRTDIANSAIDDVTAQNPKKANKMESFRMAETLKYFYLMYSEPDVVSLDEYVLNTEAHPFKRLKPVDDD